MGYEVKQSRESRDYQTPINRMSEYSKDLRTTWALTIIAVLSVYTLSFFFWNLMDIVTPFAAPFLWLLILPITIAALVRTIVMPVRHWKSLRIVSLLPLLFLIAALAATHFINFTELWLAANFRVHHTDRLQVVKRIESRELAPNVSHNSSLIALPKDLARTSIGGGQVAVQRNGNEVKVLFFTFRGVLSSFAGFVYTSNGLPPTNSDFAGRFFIVRKIEDRWFYVSAR